jgi:hypothetical protein
VSARLFDPSSPSIRLIEVAEYAAPVRVNKALLGKPGSDGAKAAAVFQLGRQKRRQFGASPFSGDRLCLSVHRRWP